MAQKRKTVRENLLLLMDGGNCSFVTLTLKHNRLPLGDQLSNLIKYFRALRQLGLWTHNVRGGAYFIEVKRSEDRTCWHPHLHVLVDAKFIDSGLLSSAWLKITGDSFIVHVRRVRSKAEDIAYVTKYATKPIDDSCFEVDEWIDEAMVAFRGRHLLSTLGMWRGTELEVRSDDPEDWRRVASLESTLNAASRGEQWATGIILWITDRNRTESSYDAVIQALPKSPVGDWSAGPDG